MASKTHFISGPPIKKALRRGTAALDANAIRAEVHRRGSTLTAIALQAGLCESACRAALIRPGVAAEKAVAEFLGVPAQLVWPNRYASDGTPIRRRASKTPSSNQDTKLAVTESPQKISASSQKKKVA